jgi:hypothetical protein
MPVEGEAKNMKTESGGSGILRFFVWDGMDVLLSGGWDWEF